jgi:hypothetical protein
VAEEGRARIARLKSRQKTQSSKRKERGRESKTKPIKRKLLARTGDLLAQVQMLKQPRRLKTTVVQSIPADFLVSSTELMDVLHWRWGMSIFHRGKFRKHMLFSHKTLDRSLYERPHPSWIARY